MELKKKVPEVRFKGFSGEWEEKIIGALCKETFGGGTPSTSDPECWNGEIPWIQSSDLVEEKLSNILPRKWISGKGLSTSATKLVPENSIAIVTRVGVGKVAFIPFKYATSQDFLSLSKLTIDSWFAVFSIWNKLQSELYAVQGTSIKGITKEELLFKKINVPGDFPEQSRIGTWFQHLDQLITLHQKKYNKLTNIKKAMLEKMFPKNGADVPEIRFEGFEGKWEEKRLGEIMNVTSVKRIHQSDWTESGIRFLRARDLVSAFKNEEPSDYLYISEEKYAEYSLISGKVKPGDLLVSGVGTIGIPLLIIDEAPVYFKDGNVIWFRNENMIEGKFFYYSFISNGIQSYIRDSAGIGTVGTYTIDSGRKTPILLPSEAEQQKIGTYFQKLDHLITLQQTQIEKLKNIKKACLEKMFV